MAKWNRIRVELPSGGVSWLKWDGHRVEELPMDDVRKDMQKYNRENEQEVPTRKNRR